MNRIKDIVKFIIHFIIHFIINLLIFPSKEIKSKCLLIIRLDAIGDYILFRNYIKELKQSQKYKDFSITLLGNVVWKELAEELDSEYVDRFIWLDRNKFAKDLFYRFSMLKLITSNGYEVVINPVYSRDFFYTDMIVNLVSAQQKIGNTGNLSNIEKWQKKISDKFYDKLVSTDNEVLFEFSRSKTFFEYILAEKINLDKPHIELKPKALNFRLPDNYVVLFIGASAKYRRWSVENFSKIGSYLNEVFGYNIVLCGGPNDRDESKIFSNYFQGEYLDLIGKTSLVELLYVIYNGSLMIANETSAPHMAVALNMNNIFVISNGNHYGRFTPYPKCMTSSYHVVYHPEIEKDMGNYKKLSNLYGHGSSLDIDEISIETVIHKINNILNKNTGWNL
ncbi:glycosyltransferase family 9 protein [Vibrio gazogenes]|uniref:ADP-heptose:LPS heptosyltransferase n=1 Tax=Vibrio gazogenes DSM 21264 = NBRC 103151 TaxID=1123492 RepID=A0A1M5D1K6_VIBGA|nr:glycosyltransferase family 9 protein [Vibrio gazogenes]USP13921.1 glycosyltransferase family 9 protein [Vibrio gazogenes]SHF60899.1 ADP-heptose:LPS heptosyltransferase [Vibrio gazogenes DSM 21264] [Vibrio gazogenes DSM 21264 = NBRC 103151]SJN56661.1 lipopolysaccharide core biosynthesis protein [Vibrio gazogenes]